MFLSNTALFYLMVEVYLHLLPKVQLHVSALDNSHLQVVSVALVKHRAKRTSRIILPSVACPTLPYLSTRVS
jgi:hypothetical protein